MKKIKLPQISKLILLVSMVLSFSGYSNNLQITNVTRTGAGEDEIHFILSWENSWSVTGAPTNHDAAWVFIKFRQCGGLGGTVWNHAILGTTTGLDESTGSHKLGDSYGMAQNIVTTNRLGAGSGHNTGMMIKRASIGKGDVSDTVRLKIIGSSTAVALTPGTEYDIKVFGIEMVYIPEGFFIVGDDASSYSFRGTSTSGDPTTISSEASQTLYDNAASSTLAANYPKGYGAFYLMKYEISVGLYVSFLNSLNTTQQTSRYYSSTAYMHDIVKNADGISYSTSSADRAKNLMSPDDMMSLLDWAALRLMTELEYEKACRGPLDYVEGEYAWGNANYTLATTVSGATSGVEVITEVNANYCNHYTQKTGGMFSADRGPLACGIFARDATQTRITTGATYYGVMEMSGNISEITVTFENSGTGYEGIWGDGQLSADGKYTNTNWPNANDELCIRGYYASTTNRGHISNRYYRKVEAYTTRDSYTSSNGGRGAR